MAISCTPSSLADAAKAFNGLPQQAIGTYLLAVIAGGSTDPKTLAAEAKSFGGLPPETLLQIQAYLLCQIVNK